jgi:hypothetical protein
LVNELLNELLKKLPKFKNSILGTQQMYAAAYELFKFNKKNGAYKKRLRNERLYSY